MTKFFRSWLIVLLAALPWAAPAVIAAQDGEPIPVYLLQGEGASTAQAGRYIDSLGIVTAVGLEGFYLQDPTGDGRTETSDGIYVYTRQRPAVQPGACVVVRDALVDEFYEKTELSRVKAIEPSSLCRTLTIAPAPLPTVRYGEHPSQRYEALEGMLVLLPRLEGVVHGPTKRYASGEAEMALAPASIQPYLSDGRVFFDEAIEQAQLLYVSGALGVPLPDLNHGDRVRITAADGAPAAAILDYNFGKYQLLLLPGSRVEMVSGAERTPAKATPASDMEFTLCSYNLMGMGSGSAQHPDPADYDHELRRRAAAIADWLAGCTVIGLQEAGQPRDVELLATLLTNEYGLPYMATALPGPQSNNLEFPLTNALLTRTDHVQVLAAQSPQACSPVDYEVIDPGVCPAGEYPLFDRAPLLVDLSVQGMWGEPFSLTVVVNHWKSKAGDEAANLPRRVVQAQQVAALVQARLAEDANAAVVVLGDLNDYYGSAPVTTVQTAPEPDLVHLYDRLPQLSRYTYIFNGASQTLDHLLVTPALTGLIGEVQPLRISADHAAPIAPAVDNVFHASDHDPVLVRVWPGGVAWIAGNVRYPGVQATLLTAGGTVVAMTESDPRGEFRLWNVAPGSYRIQLSAPPHLSLAVSDVAITVVSGENRFVTTAHHLTSQLAADIALWTAFPSAR